MSVLQNFCLYKWFTPKLTHLLWLKPTALVGPIPQEFYALVRKDEKKSSQIIKRIPITMRLRLCQVLWLPQRQYVTRPDSTVSFAPSHLQLVRESSESKFVRLNSNSSSPSWHPIPFHPGWHWHVPSTQLPCPEQSEYWQSLAGISHSAPFQPFSQWQIPPPYLPWFEHNTGQTPGAEKGRKESLWRSVTMILVWKSNTTSVGF